MKHPSKMQHISMHFHDYTIVTNCYILHAFLARHVDITCVLRALVENLSEAEMLEPLMALHLRDLGTRLFLIFGSESGESGLIDRSQQKYTKEFIEYLWKE